MKVIIIEDELPAAARLGKLLMDIDPSLMIGQKLDSVESSVRYFKTSGDADLIFMDIQLADGLCFSIFEQIQLHTPIIFTTAFDQYTLKAFKVNSIDYLLKPIEEVELRQAYQKFKLLRKEERPDFSAKISKIISELNPVKYKDRILTKGSDQLHFIKTDEIAFFYAKGKFCFAVDYNNNQNLLEHTLADLESEIQPAQFFRVNRNLIVNIDALKKIQLWFGGRLKLELAVSAKIDTVVSRERVNDFKEWLGGK